MTTQQHAQQQDQHLPNDAPEQPAPDGQPGSHVPLATSPAAQPAQHAVGAVPPQLALGAVLHGTCGWSDASLVKCGRFYPASIKAGSSSEEKLRHYSRAFANVEVDTSTYAIPSPHVTQRWAQAAAPGFLFHVKAFGLFCSQGCQVSALPAEAKALLQPAQAVSPQAYLRLSAMPEGVEAACWRRFHAALEPLYQAGKLGLVVFLFHLSFQPSQQNLQYILRCRAQLDPRFRMAAEVRCRRWFTDPAWRQQLCEALSMQGITLISADELGHETAQRDREQTGLPPGEVRQVLPIALEVTTPGCHYVRIHRRYGTVERLLPEEEIQAWAARLEQLAPQLQGPIYFL
ncbi:hypothetical protein ABPG75_011880 [Micractinium tetrahymenae]